ENAIQANMDLKDTEYFNELLQLNNAYRISRFGCTDTKKWQRTLDNKTTLDIIIYSEGENKFKSWHQSQSEKRCAGRNMMAHEYENSPPIINAPLILIHMVSLYEIIVPDKPFFVVTARVYPLHRISDAQLKLLHFRAIVKTHFNREIKAFQCDNVGEFDNNSLHELSATNGIQFRFSCLRTSQQNGKSECMIHTINNVVRSLLFQARLPPEYWVEALLTAAYLLNILPSTSINNDISYTILFNKQLAYTTYARLDAFVTLSPFHRTNLPLVPHHLSFSEPHLNAMKCVLRYLRGTTDLGLQLFRSTISQLIAYSDADWAGYTLSRSSAEAEYRGVANAVAETFWIRSLLRELHTLLFTVTLVYCDNVNLGPLNYFLGISATRTTFGIFLYQKKYATEILEQAHMLNCNPCRTPIDTEKKLGPEGSPKVEESEALEEDSATGKPQPLHWQNHGEAFSLARVAKARFANQGPTTTSATPNLKPPTSLILTIGGSQNKASDSPTTPEVTHEVAPEIPSEALRETTTTAHTVAKIEETGTEPLEEPIAIHDWRVVLTAMQIRLWDHEIKSAFQNDTLKERWFRMTGYRQVKVLEFFNCPSPRQDVEDLREGAQGDREVKGFQVSNDDTALAQRRFEDKQLKEKINTDYLVKELERNIRLGGRTRWVMFLILVITEDTIRSTYLVNRSPSSTIGFKKPIDMLGFFGWLASIKKGMLEPVKVKCIFLGYHKSIVGTGSMQVLHRSEFEVELLGDHTFEVEPQENVDQGDGLQEVQTQDLMDYHLTRDRDQHLAGVHPTTLPLKQLY
nr:ribonuclease H-like domain-containing protein [Tanacetum cinerariifolium]